MNFLPILAGAAMFMVGCTTEVTAAETIWLNNLASKSSAIKKNKKARRTSFEVVKGKVKFEHDPHMGVSTATGPEIKYKDPGRNKWTDGYNIYHLVGFDLGRSGSNVVSFSDIQLRVRKTIVGTKWPFYHSAYSQGERFDFTEVDRSVDCMSGGSCYYEEIIGIDMPIDRLREIAERSVFTIKIIGKGQSTIVEVPQSYILGFLAAIDGRESAQ